MHFCFYRRRWWSYIRIIFLIFALIIFISIYIRYFAIYSNDSNTTTPVEYGQHGDTTQQFSNYINFGTNEEKRKFVSKRNSNDRDQLAKTERSLVDAFQTNKNKVTIKVLKAVHLGVVACGDRIEEPLMMLKSAVTFGTEPLHVHVIADDLLWPKFAESLQHWQRAIKWRSFSYTLYLTSFPPSHADEWRHLFKLCACQRLFIPDLLSTTDALLYVDTDVLFLRPPEELWSHFGNFNDSHMAGLSQETEDRSTNWYVRFARHPYYKPLGVNSGVMLMNLTRMRHFNWSTYLAPILNKYRYNITWGDQDIINILFSTYPDKLYLFGCEWNYRPDHCMYSSTCLDADRVGASILHGSREYFHKGEHSAFQSVYDAFKQYKFGSDRKANLYEALNTRLSLTNASSSCGSRYDVFLKQVEAYINRTRAQVIT